MNNKVSGSCPNKLLMIVLFLGVVLISVTVTRYMTLLEFSRISERQLRRYSSVEEKVQGGVDCPSREAYDFGCFMSAHTINCVIDHQERFGMNRRLCVILFGAGLALIVGGVCCSIEGGVK